MLIATLIFVISLAAVIQFAVLSWRAALLKTASEPLPAEWEPTTPCVANSFVSNGFVDIAAYSQLCPDVGAGAAPKFRWLRVYYHALQGVERVSRWFMPQNLTWTGRELALCTRCAAVVLSHHLDRNQALAAAARSF